ncbi:hypothetical protein KR018_008634, partial [Drosophila ironensis]
RTDRAARSRIAAADRCVRGTQSYRCRVCRGIHRLRSCGRFLRLDAAKRLRAALINGYCSSCLAHEHATDVCPSGGRCRVCGGQHHTLLHQRGEPLPTRGQRTQRSPSPSTPASRPRTRSASRETASRRARAASGPPAAPAMQQVPRAHIASRHPSRPQATGPSLEAILEHGRLHILPTADVVVDSGRQRFTTVALIDPCVPVSCIDASLARAFGLRSTAVDGGEVVSASLRSVTSERDLDARLKVQDELLIRTPTRALGDEARARFDSIRLANPRFHRPSTVSLVLGADLYPQIIKPGFLNLGSGLPIGQSTVFGWTVSGVCHE